MDGSTGASVLDQVSRPSEQSRKFEMVSGSTTNAEGSMITISSLGIWVTEDEYRLRS